MQGISPSASNLGAKAEPSSTCSTDVRAAKGVEVVESVRSTLMRSVLMVADHRQEFLPRGPGHSRSSPAHSISDRTVAFASARLDRRHPPELVSTDSVGQLPTISMSMSNPFLWLRLASRAPLVILIKERYIITLRVCGTIEINFLDAPVNPAPVLH